MHISVTAETNELKKEIGILFKKQIPFAASNAINDTLFTLRKDLIKNLSEDLNKPSTFTKKAFLYEKSTKKNLTGQIYIKDKQYSYLKYHIHGGVRRAKKGALLIPTSALIPRGGKVKVDVVKSRLSKANHKYLKFGNRGGIYRVYKSKKRRPVMMGFFVDQAHYEKRLGYYEAAELSIRKNYRINLIKNIERAIKTAR